MLVKLSNSSCQQLNATLIFQGKMTRLHSRIQDDSPLAFPTGTTNVSAGSYRQPLKHEVRRVAYTAIEIGNPPYSPVGKLEGCLTRDDTRYI